MNDRIPASLRQKIDEREAASIVAALHAHPKRSHEDELELSVKRVKRSHGNDVVSALPRLPRLPQLPQLTELPELPRLTEMAKLAERTKDKAMDATGKIFQQPELKPPPYFYYTDHSQEPDDDPLTPLTAVGRVPNFPAKMHAILTNDELRDVIGWAPHGRAWRILKPREFEIRVLPKYFEHSKFSSFVRQANGWGFRRMSQGRDRNSYYHEYFLRGMPWLCKQMRRPKVAEKKAANPEMEPDLYAIGSQFPIPVKPPGREVVMIQNLLEGGPKARMPVHWNANRPPPHTIGQPLGQPLGPTAGIPLGLPLGQPLAATLPQDPMPASVHTPTLYNTLLPNMSALTYSIPHSQLTTDSEAQFAAGFMAATTHMRTLLGNALTGPSFATSTESQRTTTHPNHGYDLLFSQKDANFQK